MNMKFYTTFSALILLACCSVEEPIYEEQVIISSPPASYPTTTSTATILKKHKLPRNREEYHARLSSGREINFSSDTPLHYQIGDVVTLPLE